jgi:16S rRNA (cytosine967-C5)-methyltransferase
VVAAVASGYSRVDVSELVNKIPGLISAEGLAQDGVLRTLPGVCACDGFYAVVLERVAG